MAPAKQLQLQLVQDESNWSRLRLSGPLNEEAKAVLAPYLVSLGQRLILDFDGITSLNSSGIRDWALFIKQLKNGRTIEFDLCPEEVVRAINMVPNFSAGLPIRSVKRQYTCDSCKLHEELTFRLNKDYKPDEIPKIPVKNCQRCGTALEPAEPDEEFFIFLTSP